MALSTGKQLAGRYSLEQPLGSGGMGEVWVARDEHRGRSIALKIIDAELAAEPARIDALHEEFLRVQSLSHPNIVAVYDFVEAAPYYGIAMQLVQGGTLAASRGASFRGLLPRLLLVCDALDYSHRQGIVHGDLKASNILLDEHGTAFLADFGVAGALKSAGGRARGGSMPGQSPQQLAGEPPAVADDVYGFGALLFELMAGEPLFHPEVTAQRIRDEVPALPATDGSGEALPKPLRNLMAASLQKAPRRRPAGMGPVRAVLEELRSDYPDSSRSDVITPVRRRASPAPATPSPPPKRGRSLPGAAVMTALAVLLAVALGVVFVLPRFVEEQRPVATPAPRPPPAEPGAPDPAASDALRAVADDVLGELLVLQDELRTVAVEQWGGADWAEAARLAETGDQNYRARNYPAAAGAYREAIRQMEQLKPRVEQEFADALAAGDAALAAGDQSGAEAAYALALAINGNSEAAISGLARAGRLGELLPIVAEAVALESQGQLDQAAQKYAEALAIDADWPAAREGLARTQGTLATARYEQQMAAGFAALADQRYSQARTAFNAALASAPGDRAAQQALGQVNAEERLARVVGLEADAQAAAEREDWDAAVAAYEQSLAIDPNLASARSGLAASQARVVLDTALNKALASTEELNDDRAWQRARAAADEARAQATRGPRLTQQIAALETALRVAKLEVPVQFQSDNATRVTVYKVGSLGSFTNRVVSLRPGRYTAVGSRDGYRDKRLSFLVAADGSTPPIVLQCEERI